jgi:tetratricopeptide (TPR) repeat protein/DNA-binding XRE family transcriptional regulator
MKQDQDTSHQANSPQGDDQAGGLAGLPARIPHSETATIAERVRTARIAANKTQQQLAGDTYSKSYISAVERGKMTPSVQALGILAGRLGLPVSFFLGESDADLSVLAESSASMRSAPERERMVREDAVALMLGEAELYLRQRQPGEALARLGGEEPSEDLGAMQRPRWYWLKGWALIQKGLPTEAIPALEKGLSVAEALRAQSPQSQKGQLSEMAERIRLFLGSAYYELRQLELAVEYHRRCLHAITDGVVTDPELKLRIYVALGHDYLLLGRYQDAVGFYDYARKQVSDVDNPFSQPMIYWGLTLAHKEAGDLIRARMSVQKALMAQEIQENVALSAQLRSLFGQILVHFGKFNEAEEHLRQSLEVAERTGDTATRGLTLANYADLYIAEDKADQALKSVQDGLAVVAQTGDKRTEGQLYLTAAAAHEAQKQPQAAEDAFKKAISIFQQTEDADLIGRAHERYGKFLAEQGRFQEAYEQMHQARSSNLRRNQS